MSLFKKTSIYFLSLLMFGFASCEHIQDVLPEGTNPSETKYGNSTKGKLITDKATTNTVWKLKRVDFDDTDITNFYKDGFGELDIRSDGTFVGQVLNNSTSDPLPWKLRGDKLDLFETYTLKSVTETELVLVRNKPYQFSTGKYNYSSNSQTFYYERIEVAASPEEAIKGVWKLEGVTISKNGSHKDFTPYLEREGRYGKRILLASDGMYQGFAFENDVIEPIAWRLDAKPEINGHTLTLGEDVYQVSVSPTGLALTKVFPNGYTYVDQYGWTWEADHMTFLFTKSEGDIMEDSELYFEDTLIHGFWVAEKVMLDGVDVLPTVSDCRDRCKQYLYIKEDGTFEGSVIGYSYDYSTEQPNTWNVVQDYIILNHGGFADSTYPMAYGKVLTADETMMVMELKDQHGTLHTIHFRKATPLGG